MDDLPWVKRPNGETVIHIGDFSPLQQAWPDLGGVVVGAFHDDRVQSALGLPADHAPLYLIPVGHGDE